MKAVLLMAYGSPESLDQVEEYYTNVRGMIPPSAEQLAELKSRYSAIGNKSPLIDITRSQAKLLRSMLEKAGSETRVYIGMKHSHPFIAEAAEVAKADGIDHILCIPMAPHYSSLGIETYVKRARDAFDPIEIKQRFVLSWNKNMKLIEVWTDSIKEAAKKVNGDYRLLFTAHSLPRKVVDTSPYRAQLLETAELISANIGITDCDLCFQSAGRTSEEWAGPSLTQAIKDYDYKEKSIIIAPIGFVSDNLEILYDIDIEAVDLARSRGIKLVRCRMPNDSHKLIEALFSLVEQEGFI